MATAGVTALCEKAACRRRSFEHRVVGNGIKCQSDINKVIIYICEFAGEREKVIVAVWLKYRPRIMANA